MILALHGASAAIHDHVAGTPGDFDDVCAALEAASSCEVRTAVTRSNVASLARLAQWLGDPRRHRKIHRWTLHWPGPARPGLSLPRLGMVTPRVLHAAALARELGLSVVTEGLPACLLGPHAKHRVMLEPRAYAEGCARCDARASCEGVPAQYLTQFAGDLELRPTAAVTR